MEALFYRGDLDEQVVAAPNGGLVNRDYLKRIEGASRGAVIRQARPGVTSIVAYGISNCTVIDTDEGILIVDTGNNVGQGGELLDLIRTFTSRPVVAVIYTHHHYTGGTRAIIERSDGDVAVYAHPDLERLLRASHTFLGPMQRRRSGIQLGGYLPASGPDAVVAVPERHFGDPELDASGHVPATHPVADGEEVCIDGLRAVFHHIAGDTKDSLAIHFPDLDLVVHNSAAQPVYFPMSTLRGDFYRDPAEVIAGIDLIRGLRPGHLVGCHGMPLVGADRVEEVLTSHRDAYAYQYQQTVRGINRGRTPDEIVRDVRMPEHLRERRELFPSYIDPEYAPRGIYRGLVGWYDEDTSDLHPPAASELGEAIVDGFGGIDRLLDAARKLFDEKKYNLVAKLVSCALGAHPDHEGARRLKASALRAMAYSTRTGVQTRNFMLTEALHLDRAIDWFGPAPASIMPPPSMASVRQQPPEAALEMMEFRVDPGASGDLECVAAFRFTDVDRCFGFEVRRGVARYLGAHDGPADLTFELSCDTWARLQVDELDRREALASGQVEVVGDRALAERFLACFDQIG